jgi:hypothetical protein
LLEDPEIIARLWADPHLNREFALLLH